MFWPQFLAIFSEHRSLIVQLVCQINWSYNLDNAHS